MIPEPKNNLAETLMPLPNGLQRTAGNVRFPEIGRQSAAAEPAADAPTRAACGRSHRGIGAAAGGQPQAGPLARPIPRLKPPVGLGEPARRPACGLAAAPLGCSLTTCRDLSGASPDDWRFPVHQSSLTLTRRSRGRRAKARVTKSSEGKGSLRLPASEPARRARQTCGP